MSRGAFERGEGDHLNVRRGPLKESMVIIRRTEGVRLRRPMDTSWRVTLEKGEGHATGRSEGAALNWCIGIIGRDEGYHLKSVPLKGAVGAFGKPEGALSLEIEGIISWVEGALLEKSKCNF